ncbi:MAG: glycosyltransferase family 2 protein [Deltaproteobacteria bacterium]|nr:glycosyltransferase family 2 protein [Deltaproteobacteria bacterium]
MAADLPLSVLIVNYNTAALTRRCVVSLRAQRMRSAEDSMSPLEIIVVDNASRAEERNALSGLDATVVYNDSNRGYGAALNQAARIARGESLLFSNSDTWYFPNALQALSDAMRVLPRCGAVGPRLWWDDDRAFLLPPSDPVTPVRYLLDTAARAGSWFHHPMARWWRRRALRHWTRQDSVAQPMLSGASLFTTKRVLVDCGGFDEQFRLYYEDTDWCRRVRRKGYHLYHVPGAEVAHFYNQSGRQNVMEAQHLGRESEARYFQKHYGSWVWSALSRMVARWCGPDVHAAASRDYVDLGARSDPPHFPCSTREVSNALWQISPLPSCLPAIARFVRAPEDLVLPSQVWAHLGPGDFFARLFALPDLRVVQQWRWRKVAAESQNEQDIHASRE